MMVIFRVKQRTKQGMLCNWMFWQHRTACVSKKTRWRWSKCLKRGFRNTVNKPVGDCGAATFLIICSLWTISTFKSIQLTF